MRAIYDVFVSYPSADREPVQQLAQALRNHGLEVFVDNPEIDDFSRITTAITEGLARSKVLLAYYSAAYSRRRACQWELTAAYLAASRQGDPSRRILVVNPEPTSDHLYPGELRDALYHRAPAPGAQPRSPSWPGRSPSMYVGCRARWARWRRWCHRAGCRPKGWGRPGSSAACRRCGGCTRRCTPTRPG